MSITIIICEVETMKEPLVITMAREYASGGSEIAQKVADLLGIPLYNKELITIAAKKSGLTEEAIAASETQRSGSLIYSLYMMGNTIFYQFTFSQANTIKFKRWSFLHLIVQYVLFRLLILNFLCSALQFQKSQCFLKKPVRPSQVL